jgi:tetratricopeptide (TPR) repeat protein
LALNELSIVYLNLGEPDKAEQALRQAVKSAPDNFSLRLNLGYVLMQMKKFVEAEAELHKATLLTSSSQVAHLYRGRALVSLQKYGEAEKELRRVISLGGIHVPMAYRFLGALFKETGDRPRAIECLEKYLAMESKAADINEVREIVKELRAGLQKREN